MIYGGRDSPSGQADDAAASATVYRNCRCSCRRSAVAAQASFFQQKYSNRVPSCFTESRRKALVMTHILNARLRKNPLSMVARPTGISTKRDNCRKSDPRRPTIGRRGNFRTHLFLFKFPKGFESTFEAEQANKCFAGDEQVNTNTTSQ
jgi:hypothetical protein